MKNSLIAMGVLMTLASGPVSAQSADTLRINNMERSEFHGRLVDYSGSRCSDNRMHNAPPCKGFVGWRDSRGVQINLSPSLNPLADPNNSLLDPDLRERLRAWRDLRAPAGAEGTEEWDLVEEHQRQADRDWSVNWTCGTLGRPTCPDKFQPENDNFRSLIVQTNAFTTQAVSIAYAYSNPNEFSKQSIVNTIQARFPNNAKIEDGVLSPKGTMKLIVTRHTRRGYTIYFGPTDAEFRDWVNSDFDTILRYLDGKMPALLEAAEQAGEHSLGSNAEVDF